jgi:hypothetical protein
MSALLSTLPPPSSRSKFLRSIPSDECTDRARLAELSRLAPLELKQAAMAKYRVLKTRQPKRIGLGSAAEQFGLFDRQKPYGKTTIQYWLDPSAEERCPPPAFVLWLEKQIEKSSPQPVGVKCV